MIVKIETKDGTPSPLPLPIWGEGELWRDRELQPLSPMGRGVMRGWRMTGEGQHETVALIEKEQTCH
jgi:hypothetical protein